MNEDMIYRKRPPSSHKKMSLYDRAAQFAPFAALTGYDDAVKETARLTDEQIELDAAAIEELDQALSRILEHIEEQPEITCIYFVKDERKDGGSYQSMTGLLKRFDEYEHTLIFTDKTRIRLDTIIRLTSPVLNDEFE